ncbi:MAG: hypothetical protein HWD61_15400 [Parachlamydiaceae bacterium]|nr:MAG: hypothetical protein HWD61_15400 [Parachlamydiaceae bacterium]
MTQERRVVTAVKVSALPVPQIPSKTASSRIELTHVKPISPEVKTSPSPVPVIVKTEERQAEAEEKRRKTAKNQTDW